MRDARMAMERVENVTKNLRDIAGKINRGEGTIGKLLNDEETVDHINSAIANVNNFMGGVSDMQTSLDFSSWYLARSSAYKSFIGLKIQPGTDRYYLVQVVDAPEGTPDTTDTVTSINGSQTRVDRKKETLKNRLKVSVLFAKNYFNFTLKGGIIEGVGGAGIDYFPLNDHSLKLTAEAYDFQNLQLRAYARYDFTQGLYFTAGINNIMSTKTGYGSGVVEPFVGAGFYFTNDDIRSLVRRVRVNK